MGNITAQMVKALRDQTGAGMMDCKTALAENDGDVAAATDWLRAKGLSRAAKKAGRVTAEGLVAVAVGDGRGAVVEVNAETDFVARNEQFQAMVRTIADVALSLDGDYDATCAAPFPSAAKSVQDHVAEMIGTIGENMTFRRSQGLAVESGVVEAYVHNAMGDGLGRIGVIVALSSEADPAALKPIARQIAMHVAAASPLSVSVDDLDPDVIARERSILVEQARESGKPEEIIEKMVEGRLRKYYQEVVLLEQTFVVDGERTVSKVLKDASQETGTPVELAGFARLVLGEGVEKEETDFAAEVAAAASGG